MVHLDIMHGFLGDVVIFQIYDREICHRACHFNFLGARHVFGGLFSISLRACDCRRFVELKISTAPFVYFVVPEQKFQISCRHLFFSSFVQSPGDSHFRFKLQTNTNRMLPGLFIFCRFSFIR